MIGLLFHGDVRQVLVNEAAFVEQARVVLAAAVSLRGRARAGDVSRMSCGGASLRGLYKVL